MSENFVEKKFYIHLRPMNKLSSILAFLLLLVSLPTEAKQGPPPPYATPPPGLPIDTNLVVLLVVLLIYGAYKIYQNKQKTSI